MNFIFERSAAVRMCVGVRCVVRRAHCMQRHRQDGVCGEGHQEGTLMGDSSRGVASWRSVPKAARDSMYKAQHVQVECSFAQQPRSNKRLGEEACRPCRHAQHCDATSQSQQQQRRVCDSITPAHTTTMPLRGVATAKLCKDLRSLMYSSATQMHSDGAVCAATGLITKKHNSVLPGLPLPPKHLSCQKGAGPLVPSAA